MLRFHRHGPRFEDFQVILGIISKLVPSCLRTYCCYRNVGRILGKLMQDVKFIMHKCYVECGLFTVIMGLVNW